MTNLAGRIALVTGSTKGLGLEILKTFAGAGAHVALHGICATDARFQKLADELSSEYSVQVARYEHDLRSPQAIQDMIADIHKTFGKLDILVNNAGLQYVSPIQDFPGDKLDDILAVNLTASFITIRSALPKMMEVGWGRIINIGSMHALVASPWKTAYNASKHGVAGLTKTVALETAQAGITCNAICPGLGNFFFWSLSYGSMWFRYMLTDLVKNQLEDQARIKGISKEQVISDVLLVNQPTKKFVEVKDVAQLVRLELLMRSELCVAGALFMWAIFLKYNRSMLVYRWRMDSSIKPHLKRGVNETTKERKT